VRTANGEQRAASRKGKLPCSLSAIRCPQSVVRALSLHSAFCILLFVTCSRPEPKTGAGYNLLLITLDTTRADHLGSYGDRSAETPVLDALAAGGLRFENASSPVPLTLPAHCSLLSGLLPQRHSVRDNGYGSFPENRDTLATIVSRSRYRTAAFVGAFVLDHRFGLARGFDVYDDDIPRDPADTSSFEAERKASAVIDRVIRWLGQPDARPFFVWVHLYDPHAPYDPPEPFKSRFRSSPYDGEIAYVDSELGRLLAELDKRHLRERTIIAVVGDHGEALGEHGELTHGLLLYEPTLHVPLIISAPGLLEKRVVSSSISSVDLAPTLAGLLNTPFPAAADRDGRDLSKPLLQKQEPPAADVYAETRYPAIFGWSPLTALRSGTMKLIAGPTSELYDLRSDPRESRNILSEQRRTWRALADRLGKLSGPPVAQTSASPLDEETKAKLASLGYVAPGAIVQSSNADPKAMAPLFRLFEEATWATNDNRLAEAIPKLEKIVAADPANPVFRGSLARALRRSGQLKKAILQYQEAVARQPADPEAWYNLAVSLQEAGRSREAGVAIREALRRDSRRPEAHNALGIALMGEGNVDGAREEFEKAVALDPRDVRGWNNIGNARRARGDLAGAAASYQRAIAVAPRYADPYNGLGVLAVQADHPADALRYFDQAVAIAPDFYEARLNRAIALEILGRKDRAHAELRDLLARLPRKPEFENQRKAAAALLAR
jgi:choline-sulfatase